MPENNNLFNISTTNELYISNYTLLRIFMLCALVFITFFLLKKHL